MNMTHLPLSEFQRMTLRYLLYLVKHTISTQTTYIYMQLSDDEKNAINDMYDDLMPEEMKEATA